MTSILVAKQLSAAWPSFCGPCEQNTVYHCVMHLFQAVFKNSLHRLSSFSLQSRIARASGKHDKLIFRYHLRHNIEQINFLVGKVMRTKSQIA